LLFSNIKRVHFEMELEGELVKMVSMPGFSIFFFFLVIVCYEEIT
jgi:hypothetical protein